MAHRYGTFLTAAFAALLFPDLGWAQDGDQRAQAHFAAGSSYFSVGDYERAMSEFTLSYELSGRAALLHNIAICHERLGDLESAVAFMERFLAEAVEVPDRPLMEERLANMRDRLERQREANRVALIPFDPPIVPPVVEEPDNTPAMVSFISGGVGLATFAIFGGLALHQDRELDARCTLACSRSELAALRRNNIIADVGLGVGAVGMVLGTMFAIRSRRGGSEETSVTLRSDGVAIAF